MFYPNQEKKILEEVKQSENTSAINLNLKSEISFT